MAFGTMGARGAGLRAAAMVSVSLAALGAASAHAADTPEGTQVQEVVVTANRSGAESLQKVAIPISVVNTTVADRSGLGNLADLVDYAPSLTVVQGAPGFNQISMLGLTAVPYRTSDTSDRSLVAVYLDDTPISVQGQTPDLRVYDLERVEILRGPQGTLYGDSSMAGTVRYITAKPDSHSQSGTLEATGAGTEHGSASYSIRGMLNAPIIKDVLAFRGTVYFGRDGGYISNVGDVQKSDANFNNSVQARGALRWTPDSTTTVDAAVTFEQSRSGGLNTAWSGLPKYEVATNAPESTKDSFQLYQLNIEKDLPAAQLISSTAYTWRRIGYYASTEPTIGYYFANYYGLPNALYNPPGSYNPAVDDKIPAEHYDISNKLFDFMQEVRLVGKDTGRFKWNVGVFFENQKRHLYQDIPVAGFDTYSYAAAFYQLETGKPYNSQTVDGAFNPNDIFSGLQDMDSRQIAVFTDDTLHLTSRLDITAGVRWFNYHESYYLYEGGVYGAINHVPLTENTTETASGFNPRVNVSYHASDDVLVYAEASKGFRYGGANQPVPTQTPAAASGTIPQKCLYDLQQYGFNAAPLTFGPDHLWDYTVGEKAKLDGGRVTFNADAYYITWSDVQTRLLLNCSYFFTESAGTIHSKGVEVESTVRLTRDITVAGNLGYNDSRAAGNIPTVGAYNGDQSPYSPRWILSAFIYYDRPLYDGQLHLQASYQYRSKEDNTFNPYATSYNAATGSLTTTGNSATFAVIPPSNNVNLSAAYDIGRYEIGIYGTNIINGVRVVNIGRPTYYANYVAGVFDTIARPATFGARVKVKF